MTMEELCGVEGRGWSGRKGTYHDFSGSWQVTSKEHCWEKGGTGFLFD